MARIKARKGRGSPMVMHKGELKRVLQAKMKWLLRFLNTDIGSLSSVECLKLYLDFGVFLYGEPYYDFIRKKYPLQEESFLAQTKKLLKRSQKTFEVMLDGILMDAKAIENESDARLLRSSSDTYQVWYHVAVSKDRVWRSPPNYFLEPPFRQVLESEDEQMQEIFRGQLVDSLIAVIGQFPLSRIKICQKPDCGKYFYQKTTKSKGDFCSRKCQNWSNTNRWRENHRSEYNAYHRNWRAKAKEPWIKITCLGCGYEYPKEHPDPGTCSECGEKLKYEVQFLEEGEWKSEQFREFSEAEELRKDILEFERNEGRGANGKG